MRTTSLLLACALCAFTSNAQLNMGKLKEKATDKASGKVSDKIEDKLDGKKSSPAEPAEKPKSQYAIDQENMKNSPAHAEIFEYRSYVGITEDHLKFKQLMRVDSSALAYRLEQIKLKDPNWVDMARDQAAFDSIMAICKPYWDEERYRDQILWASRAASSLTDNSGKYNRLQPREQVTKVKFERLKANYMSLPAQSDYSMSMLRDVDNFYATYVPKMIADVLKEKREKLALLEKHSKMMRTQPDYLTKMAANKNTPIEPESTVKHIAEMKEDLLKAELFAPGDTAVSGVLQHMDRLTADFSEYKSSGDYARDVVTVDDLILGSVRCPKGVNTNANYIAIVKRDLKEIKATRISITDKDWFIKKNEYGAIRYKYMQVYIVYTGTDGKCYIGAGYLYSDYAGGGKYLSPYFSLQEVIYEEISCKNAMK